MVQSVTSDLTVPVDFSNLVRVHHRSFGIGARNIESRFEIVFQQQIQGTEICGVAVVYADGYVLPTSVSCTANRGRLYRLYLRHHFCPNRALPNTNSRSFRWSCGNRRSPAFRETSSFAVVKLRCKIGHQEHLCRSPEPPGLSKNPEQPFCADPLNPFGSAFLSSRNKVQSSAQANRASDPKLQEAICVLRDPHLLFERSETDNQMRGTKTSNSAQDRLVPFLVLDVRAKGRRISVDH